MICNNCGKENDHEALFCKYCGAKLEKICPSCKAKLELSVDICPYCGSYVNAQIEKKKPATAYSPKRKFIFTMAILSNVFASFFGFIFGIIAWRTGNRELQMYPRDWMVRVGRIVGKIFTFISIGLTLYIVFIIIASIIAGGSFGETITNTNGPFRLR